ncbi:MAG: glycine zipper family protein [Actinomycetota bacterium]|nr:glycine zipper family protein [Actinomycetota bacterium]
MTGTIGRRHLEAAPRANPAQRVVASFRRYADAERAVDYLLDRGIPADRVAIVASDLRLVERLTARLGYAGAATNGAVAGAVIGALFGFVAGIFDWIEPLVAGLALALYGLVLGGLAGAVAGAVLHAVWRPRRDFSSVGRLEARRYDVMVDETRATEAVEVLESRRDGPPRHGGFDSGDGRPPEPA